MTRWFLIGLMVFFALLGASLWYYLVAVEAEGPFHDELVPELIGFSVEGFVLVGLLTLVQRAFEQRRRSRLSKTLRASFRGLLSHLDLAFLEPDADPAPSQRLEADAAVIEEMLAELERKHPDLDCLVGLKQEAGETLPLTRDLVGVAAQLGANHMNWWVAIVDSVRKLAEAGGRESAEAAIHDLLINIREFDRAEF